jgi:hypothetical protein
MTATCHRAIRSIRACERRNLIQALQATLAGRPRLSAYHRRISHQCRQDARALQLTAH